MVNPALASLLLGINCSDLKLADPSVLMSSEYIDSSRVTSFSSSRVTTLAWQSIKLNEVRGVDASAINRYDKLSASNEFVFGGYIITC